MADMYLWPSIHRFKCLNTYLSLLLGIFFLEVALYTSTMIFVGSMTLIERNQ